MKEMRPKKRDNPKFVRDIRKRTIIHTCRVLIAYMSCKGREILKKTTMIFGQYKMKAKRNDGKGRHTQVKKIITKDAMKKGV